MKTISIKDELVDISGEHEFVAKGRNGYFNVAEIEVWALKRPDMSLEGMIEIYSKRRGMAPPIRIESSLENLKAVAAKILECIEHVENEVKDR